MFYYIILIWVFITNVKFISSELSRVSLLQNDCNDLLDEFSNAVSNFTLCSVKNAQPVTLCQNCSETYFNFITTYNQLSKTHVNGTACIDNFVNLDRLQVVHYVYKNANDLWSRARCNECVQIVNGTYVSTKVKQEFDKVYNEYLNCRIKYNSTDQTYLCNMCIDAYVELNNYYLSVGDITNGIQALCMDIVDKMNNTQSNWSKTCCQYRVKNEIVYLVTTVFMCSLPILFYVLVKLFVDIRRPSLLPQNRFAESMNTPSTSIRRESQ